MKHQNKNQQIKYQRASTATKEIMKQIRKVTSPNAKKKNCAIGNINRWNRQYITYEVCKDFGHSYQHQVIDIFHCHDQDQVAMETHNDH